MFKSNQFKKSSHLVRSVVGFALAAVVSPTFASSLSWTSTGTSTLGGSGTWDTSSSLWWNGSSSQAWSTNTVTGDAAVLGGTAGTVTLGTNINASGLTFSTTGYTVALGANTLTIGSGGIDASALSSGTTTISNTTGKLFIGNGLQTWNVGSGATLAVGTIGAGADAADLYSPNGAITFIKGAGTVTTTDADGWGWRSGAVAGTGVLGPGMVIDNGNGTYDMASVGTQTSGTSHTIVAPTYTTASNTDAHNVLVTSNTTVSTNASWVSLKVSGATLTNNGANLYVDTGIILQNGGTLAGSAPIKANADGFYIYVPDSGTISSSLQNNGATAKLLYKAGAGTLTLSGTNNTYSAGTKVLGGKLNVSGSITGAGAVAVSGGTLGGSGTVAGAVTVTNGSRLAPGAITTSSNFGSAGTLTLTSASGLTLTNANLDFDLSTTAGGSNDKVALNTANLTFTTLNFSYAGTTLDTTTPYTLISTTGSLSGGTLSSITSDFSNVTGGVGYTAVYSFVSGTGLQVTFTAVPESGSTAFAVIALLSLVVLIRRRTQQEA